MKNGVKKVTCVFLTIFVSGIIGMLMWYLWPLFTMWFIQTELNIVFVMSLCCLIIILSFLITSIPLAIAKYFKLLNSKGCAIVCSLLMGLPVTIKQILNWNLYTLPSFQKSFRVEGGSAWTAVLCIIFPGIMSIVATYFRLTGKWD
ncbi:MAG: hypothetical protein ACOYEL_06895 [Saccharofermentanales bacterium]|jgi:hypothetical protein